MRRSTALSLPLQLAFPARTDEKTDGQTEEQMNRHIWIITDLLALIKTCIERHGTNRWTDRKKDRLTNTNEQTDGHRQMEREIHVQTRIVRRMNRQTDRQTQKQTGRQR